MRFSFFSNFIPIQKLNTSKSSKVSKDCCNSDNQIIINLTNRVDAGMLDVFLHHHKSRLASAAQIESAGGCRRDRWRQCGLLMRGTTPTPALSTEHWAALTPGIVNSFVSTCKTSLKRRLYEGFQRFRNHEEGPYEDLLLVESLSRGLFRDCEIFANLCLTFFFEALVDLHDQLRCHRNIEKLAYTYQGCAFIAIFPTSQFVRGLMRPV